MNKYFALRKANRMRTKMLTEKSQEQLKEVIAYLRSVTFDICGVEVVQSDLIDIAMRANEEGCELFQFITDAETFVNEVKPSMKPLRWPDFLIFEISVLCFLGIRCRLTGDDTLDSGGRTGFQNRRYAGVSVAAVSLCAWTLLPLSERNGEGRISAEKASGEGSGIYGTLYSGAL